MSNLKNKRVITAALCGSWATKDMNPAVPYTPEEIARDAYECWKAGAAIVHIHVRNADGSPSTKFELYKETIERIRAFPDCDVCLNITSSGSVDFGDEERIYPLQQLLPELASYDAGTLNWQNRTVFMNPPAFLEKLGYALQSALQITPHNDVCFFPRKDAHVIFLKMSEMFSLFPMPFAHPLSNTAGACAKKAHAPAALNTNRSEFFILPPSRGCGPQRGASRAAAPAAVHPSSAA